LREVSQGKGHMNSDNAISSCHLPEWVAMGWACLGGGMEASMGCRWGGEG
jgi:hypothetical protein